MARLKVSDFDGYTKKELTSILRKAIRFAKWMEKGRLKVSTQCKGSLLEVPLAFAAVYPVDPLNAARSALKAGARVDACALGCAMIGADQIFDPAYENAAGEVARRDIDILNDTRRLGVGAIATRIYRNAAKLAAHRQIRGLKIPGYGA